MYFLWYYSAEYEYAIRPVIRAKYNANLVYNSTLNSAYSYQHLYSS